MLAIKAECHYEALTWRLFVEEMKTNLILKWPQNILINEAQKQNNKLWILNLTQHYQYIYNNQISTCGMDEILLNEE